MNVKQAAVQGVGQRDEEEEERRKSVPSSPLSGGPVPGQGLGCSALALEGENRERRRGGGGEAVTSSYSIPLHRIPRQPIVTRKKGEGKEGKGKKTRGHYCGLLPTFSVSLAALADVLYEKKNRKEGGKKTLLSLPLEHAGCRLSSACQESHQGRAREKQ